MSTRLISRYWVFLSVAVVCCLAAAFPAPSARALPRRSGPGVRCVARGHPDEEARARRMARAIDARLDGRRSSIGLKETDTKTGITCTYDATWHFFAASVIKVTILAALLHKAQEQRRHLTPAERRLAWLMITQSDNDAATALWDDVGFARMQRFVKLARMRQTRLAQAWGLSLITAHDEVLLLKLIARKNTILSKVSRGYARYLMAHVIAWQRWGVPAGGPGDVKVHVKNGWLPYPVLSDWEVNSVGFFTGRRPHRVYIMAMLTHANPSMGYGIETIEDVAKVINRRLNPGRRAAIGESARNPTWGVPDEPIPPRRG